MIRILESIAEDELVNNINDVFKKIQQLKKNYDDMCNSICDIKQSKGYLFNIKLLDAKEFSHGEKCFNVFAEDMWNEWIEGIEEITQLPYDDIMIHDNETNNYIRFSRDYVICCDEEIDFSNMIDFLKSLEHLNIITLFYNKPLDKFIIDDKIIVDKLKEVFMYEDENALHQYIIRLNTDLTDIYNDLHIKIDNIEKIIKLYNNIKENQVKKFSTYDF